MKSSSIAPGPTAATLAILRAKVFVHPDAARCVKSWQEIKSLPQSRLLTVACQLNIDIDRAIREAKANPEATEFSIIFAELEANDYAFSGEIEFDLEMKLLGATFRRRARVVYDYTPEWNYVSGSTGKERLGWGNSSVHLEIEATPEGDAWTSKNGKPVKLKNKRCWTKVELLQDGLLPKEIKTTIYSLIDDDARRQDKINRTSFNVRDRIEMGHDPKRQGR